eukprot:GEMP01027207.1.p1 GENE.GEMP01027207.1~~GEMP01027207.1.p1  ORF type:complete len:330 (+),score=60.97 GEMP01027207.1:148-1137(+)
MDPLLGDVSDTDNAPPRAQAALARGIARLFTTTARILHRVDGDSSTELPWVQVADASAQATSDRPHEQTTQQEGVQREHLWTRRGFMSLMLLGMGASCFLAMAYMYCQGWHALVVHGRDPCDVALGKWLACYLFFLPTDLDFFSCRIRPWIYRMVCCWEPAFPGDEPPGRVRVLQFVYLFGVFQIYSTGFTMLASSKTCESTAPELYDWVEEWLSVGLLLWFLFHTFTACSILTMQSMAVGGNRGAHPETVNNMETMHYEAADLWDGEDGRPSRECCICMENYGEHHEIKRTACNHVFHATCLRNWLKSQRSCPLCRIDLEQSVVPLKA